MLFMVFKFDAWHISPSKNRVYPNDIVRFCNGTTQKNKLAEIGCGLGDTLSRIDFIDKIGYDQDINVLRAASWLHQNQANLQFGYFSFPESKLSTEYDIIIAVNWIHNFDPQTVGNIFTDYFKNHLSINGFLIVDCVNNPKYKYQHHFEDYFKGLPGIFQEIGTYQSGRKIIAIQKIDQ